MTTSLEFLKLEKIAFGGLNGGSLNQQITEIYGLFYSIYKVNLTKIYFSDFLKFIFLYFIFFISIY